MSSEYIDLGPAEKPTPAVAGKDFEDLGPADFQDLGPADKKIAAGDQAIAAGVEHRALSDIAASHLARIRAEQAADQPPGYFTRVGQELSKTAAQAKQAVYDPNPITSLAKAADVPFKAVESFIGPAIEPYARLAGAEQPVAEAVGQTGAQVASALIPIPGLQGESAAEGLAAHEAAPEARTLVEDEGQVIAKNPPPSETNQANYLKTLGDDAVDTSKVQEIGDHVADREGIQAPAVEIDPEAQISKTNPEGTEVTIEPGTEGEQATRVEHELQHVKEKQTGVPPPPENNDAIIQEALSKEQGASFAIPGPSRIPPALAQQVLREGVNRGVVDQVGSLFTSGVLKWDQSRLISDQVMEAITSGSAELTEPIRTVLDQHGIGLAEFGTQMLRKSVAEAGRTMQVYSKWQRLMNDAAENGLDDIAKSISNEAGPWARTYWRANQVVDIWRALLTTKFSTTARNFLAHGVTFGIDAMDKTVEAGIQKLAGLAPSKFEAQAAAIRAGAESKIAAAGLEGMEAGNMRRAASMASDAMLANKANLLSPLDGIEQFMGLFSPGRNKELTELLLKQSPEVQDKLFTTYMSDISTKVGLSPRPLDQALNNVQKGARALNYFNQLQTFMYRRTALITGLDTKMSKVGQNAEELIRSGKIADFLSTPTGQKIASDVIDSGLARTFATAPPKGSPIAGVLQGINQSIVGKLFAPFARFTYNAAKFFFQHSPLGLLKLLSPAERASIAAGNMSTYSKAITGMLTFGAYYEFRQSRFAGEKFYEVRVGDHTIDLRPFNPYLGTMLLADYLKRYNENTLTQVSVKDIGEAALSANVSGGSGLYLLDQAANLVSQHSNTDKFLSQMIPRAAGGAVSGFLTPIAQVRDVMAEYDDYLKTRRESSDEPFMGQIKAKLPIHSGEPARYSALQSEPQAEISPVTREATALRIQQPKNPVQKEIDRLGIEEHTLAPHSGDPKLDNIIAQKMGPIVEDQLTGYIASPEYKAMDNIQKVNAIERMMKPIHAQAIKQARYENPELFEKNKEARKPWYEKELVEEHPPDVETEEGE